MRRAATDATWDDDRSGRPRVVLECPPAGSPQIVARAIERHGYEVRICEGPDRRHQCPLVHDGACALVNGADVVVNLLGTDPGDPAADVLPAVAGERRPPAIVSDRAPADDHAHRVVITDRPLTTGGLIGAIGEALADRDRPAAIWGDGFC